MPLRLSAIVPTWNEAGRIVRTLRNLRRSGVDEVIVVDGGSGDNTALLAREHADRVLEAPGGLFLQLNAGAEEARGDVLLFHYADVELLPEARPALERALEDERVAGGAFRLELASTRWCYRLIAAGAAVRNRLGLGPFGDQTIFVRAAAFRELGGYRPEILLADHDLLRRLRRQGKVALLSVAVRASVRRWEQDGVVRTQLRHAWLCALHLAGRRRVPPSKREGVEALRKVR